MLQTARVESRGATDRRGEQHRPIEFREAPGRRRTPEIRGSRTDSRFRWWRGRDLNPRPSGYEPDELPNCSTPRRAADATAAPPVSASRSADLHRDPGLPLGDLPEDPDPAVEVPAPQDRQHDRRAERSEPRTVELPTTGTRVGRSPQLRPRADRGRHADPHPVTQESEGRLAGSDSLAHRDR